MFLYKLNVLKLNQHVLILWQAHMINNSNIWRVASIIFIMAVRLPQCFTEKGSTCIMLTLPEKRIFNSWYFNSLHPPRPSHGFSILFSWNLLYCIKHGLYLSDTQLQTSISTIKKCVFLLQELTITATKSSSNLLQTLHISDPCLDLHITWHCCLYPINIKGKKKILFVELENFTFILSCPSLS